MKILLVSQYYWPENSRVTDIAQCLKSDGNEITVLTGLPNYPEGYIYDGFKNKENWHQCHNGIKIIRAKLIARRNNIFHRVLNYYSFPYYANKIVNKLDQSFDVVLAIEESPIMLVKPAIKYAKKYNKKLIMYALDLWPESLLAGGIKKNSFIYNHYKKVSSNLYSQFNKIFVSTKEHIDYIKHLPKCKNLNIEYLPQYADYIFESSKCKTIDNGIIDLMFAGNIGKAQSLQTIIYAASLLNNSKVKFHIVGSGSELNNIKKLANDLNLNNVIFYGKKNIKEMPSIYEIADAMVVTLENKDYANLTIPGKIQSYICCGKPVIGSVNGSCANFIKNNRIGYVCDSGDYKQLAKIILNLEYKTLLEIGKNARNVYVQKYSRNNFVSKLIKELNSK